MERTRRSSHQVRESLASPGDPSTTVTPLNDYVWAPRKRCSTSSTALGLDSLCACDDESGDSDNDTLEATTSTTCSVETLVSEAALGVKDDLTSPTGAAGAGRFATTVEAVAAARARRALATEPAPEKQDSPLASDDNEDTRVSSCKSFGFCTLVGILIVCGCACQGPYEVMNTRDKGCAQLISLAEHLFGLVASFGAFSRPRQLPMAFHLCLALSSSGYTQLQNAALGTSLPTIVLITMKNGNLVANMLLGVWVLGRRYSLQQKGAVLCVSMGLIFTTLPGADRGTSGAVGMDWGCLLGIVLLAGALLCRAAGSILQEIVCRDYCVQVDELLLFRNLLGLPIVLAQWRSIAHHAERWSAGPEACGLLWGLLVMNVLFDHITRVAVTHLIERTSALTANLILTIQRFVAFVISATVLSSDPLGVKLWVGAVAILAGSALYTLASAPTEHHAEKAKRA